jgi:hypothetical protein
MSQASTQNKKNPWQLLGLVIWGILILGVPGWFAVRYVRDKIAEYKQEQAEKRNNAIHMELVRERIKSFMAVNLAVDDWRGTLCRQRHSDTIFTSDLQHAFKREDNRPILIFGILKDIKEQDGQYLLTFDSDSCGDSELRFELTADPEHARDVFGHRQEPAPYYAIAAQTGVVDKNEDGPPDSDLAHKKMFVVRGRCSGLLFVGLDGVLIHLEQSLQTRTTQ